MSVRRKIAALGALAGTAVVMGAGVASAAPQPQPEQNKSQPDAPAPSEIKGAPFGQIDVDVPVGFADTGATQFGSPAAPQQDAPVLGIGGSTPPKMPAPPAPQPTPPLPLPEPKPEPTPAPDQGKDKPGKDKPGEDFPSPLSAAAGAGGQALNGATGTVDSKTKGLPVEGVKKQAQSKVGGLGGGGPLGALGGVM